jgi:predicted nucleic acid-binding protein
VRYLLDSNVWLESIAGGAHEREANALIRSAPTGSLATTDFALHTAGIILGPANPPQFRVLLDDLIRRGVFTLHLAPSALYTVLDRMAQFGLDFDDAFQYVAAERDDLTIISFDSDFDRTPRGRPTPAQALAQIASPPTSPPPP